MPYYRKTSLNQTLLVTGALLTAASVASGQVVKGRHRDVNGVVPQLQSAPGQVILYCQPNTDQATIVRLAAMVNAQATPLLLDDAYLLKLDAAHLDQASTAAAIAQLKLDPSVRGAGPNNIQYPRQATGGAAPKVEPNDPRYVKGDQYALKLINMPQAWTLQKGDVRMSVACLDTGFDLKHEDAPLFSPGSMDIADGDTDVTADGGGGPGEFDHGVGTSGVMLANTNNGKGIAGVIWNRMPLVAIKIVKKGDSGALNSVSIDSLAYLTKNVKKYNITAANYSFGSHFSPSLTDPTGAFQAAINNLVTAGIHFVQSAGNDGDGGPDSSDTDNTIKVSAVGPDPTKLAYYSNFNKITIAAPGGDLSAQDANGVLVMNASFAPSTTLYSYEQGTSFASPHVAAVLGLLRSVPGVDYARAQDALLTQANHNITGQTTVPDPKFGAGLLDAYASLVKVSDVVFITEPQGIDPSTNTSTAPSQATPAPVETLRPRVSFTANNVKVVNGVPQVNVVVVTTGGSRPLITNGVIDPTAVGANGAPLITGLNVVSLSTDPTFPRYQVTFNYAVPDAPTSQQQQITVSSTPSDPTLPAATSSLVFNVTPHVFPAGISMVSFPIAETAGLSPDPNKPVRDVKDILATSSVTLYRWVNAPIVDATGKPNVQGQYAIYGSGAGDNLPQLATLHPSDIVTTPVPAIDPFDNPNNSANTISDATPVGVGYFINLPAGAAVRSFGREFTQQSVRVPLHEGWNMVGDPFTFPIAFANAVFETSNGTRYAANEAANTAKLILPYIYRFVGNDYDFQTLPNGVLNPWEGNWIYVNPKDPTAVNPSSKALTMVMSPTEAGTSTTRSLGAGKGLANTHRAVAANTPGQHLASKPDARGPGSWTLNLVARSKNLIDAHNYIGMSSTATDGDDLTKAPKPPKVGSNVTLGIKRASHGALYAQDLRALGGAKTWNVVVTSDQPNADVTIAWPAAHSVPRNYQLTLTDVTTGQVVDLRNRASYQFNSGPKAQAREFTITAQPGNSGDRVVFNNVFVTQHTTTKSAGTSLYHIDYNVSQGAQVEVTILGTGGRTIAQIDSGRAVGGGDNHAVWNGKDITSRPVPAGSYIVRLRAVTAEGKVTQYHYPLIVTGR